MSNLSAFLKKNKKVRENVFYAASADFTDENGAPVQWELRPVSTVENDRIREECTAEIREKKGGAVRHKLNQNLYMAKLACASIIFPNLNDAALQDSYGVKTPEALLKEMLDNPGEYADLLARVSEISGFDRDAAEEIEEAKN